MGAICSSSAAVQVDSQSPAPQQKGSNIHSSKLQSTNKKSVLPPINRERTGIAFDIKFDSETGGRDSETVSEQKMADDVFSRPLPPRLKRLEPLDNARQLTAQDLDNKMKLVEINRQESISRRLSFNRKESRRRSELRAAIQQASTHDSVEHGHDDDANAASDKLKTAERNREAKLQLVQEKQRLRAERVKRNRERARMIKESGETEISQDMETMQTENHRTKTLKTMNQEDSGQSENDSWLSDNEKKRSVKSASKTYFEPKPLPKIGDTHFSSNDDDDDEKDVLNTARKNINDENTNKSRSHDMNFDAYHQSSQQSSGYNSRDISAKQKSSANEPRFEKPESLENALKEESFGAPNKKRKYKRRFRDESNETPEISSSDDDNIGKMKSVDSAEKQPPQIRGNIVTSNNTTNRRVIDDDFDW